MGASSSLPQKTPPERNHALGSREPSKSLLAPKNSFFTMRRFLSNPRGAHSYLFFFIRRLWFGCALNSFSLFIVFFYMNFFNLDLAWRTNGQMIFKQTILERDKKDEKQQQLNWAKIPIYWKWRDPPLPPFPPFPPSRHFQYLPYFWRCFN